MTVTFKSFVPDSPSVKKATELKSFVPDATVETARAGVRGGDYGLLSNLAANYPESLERPPAKWAGSIQPERTTPNTVDQFVPGPEITPIQRAKQFIRERTGYFEPKIEGKQFREEKPLRTAAVEMPAFLSAKALSGLGLNVPDIITNKITGDAGLAEAVNRVTGFVPTDKEMSQADQVEFVSGLTTAGGITGQLVKRVAARKALKTMLGAGLTFATRKAGEEISDKAISGDPIDIEGIHLEGGIGVLFGAGEVGVERFARFIQGLRAGKSLAEWKPTEGVKMTPEEHRVWARAQAKAEVEAANKAYMANPQDPTAAAEWRRVTEKYGGAGSLKAERLEVPPVLTQKAETPVVIAETPISIVETKVPTKVPKQPAAMPTEPTIATEAKEVIGPAPAAGKEPWRMTSTDYVFERVRPDLVVKPVGYEAEYYRTEHKAIVRNAIEQGKPVPPEVLADYPDLRREAPREPAVPEAKPFGRSVIVTHRGVHGEAVEWTWPNVGTITREKIKGKERYVARTANEEFRALSLDSAVDRMAATIPEINEAAKPAVPAEAAAPVAAGPEEVATAPQIERAVPETVTPKPAEAAPVVAPKAAEARQPWEMWQAELDKAETPDDIVKFRTLVEGHGRLSSEEKAMLNERADAALAKLGQAERGKGVESQVDKVLWHASRGPLDMARKFKATDYPDGLDLMDYMGLHLGTKKAAKQRTKSDFFEGEKAVLTPLAWNVKRPFGDRIWTEDDLRSAIKEYGHRQGIMSDKNTALRAKAEMQKEGYDGILYYNSEEAPGSVSVIVFNSDAVTPPAAPQTQGEKTTRPQLSVPDAVGQAFNAGYDQPAAKNPHIASSPLADAFALGQYAKTNNLTGRVRKSRGYTWVVGDDTYRVDSGVVTPTTTAEGITGEPAPVPPPAQAGIVPPAASGATEKATIAEQQPAPTTAQLTPETKATGESGPTIGKERMAAETPEAEGLTLAERQKLRKLGYSFAHLQDMDPQRARNLLEAGLRRGMSPGFLLIPDPLRKLGERLRRVLLRPKPKKVAPSGQESGYNKMNTALRRAREGGRKVRGKQRETRRKNMAMALDLQQKLVNQGVPLEEAIRKSRAAHGGAQTEYEGIYASVRDEVADILGPVIQRIHRLTSKPKTYWTGQTLLDAFNKLIDGNYLPPHEVKLIQRYIPELAVEAYARIPLLYRFVNAFFEATNAPKSILCGFADMSGFGRQARALGMAHPKLYWQYTKLMHRAFFSQKAAEEGQAEIEASPFYETLLEYNLQIPKWGPEVVPVEMREDRYAGSGLLGRRKILGIPFRAAERAFTPPLSWFRAAVAEDFLIKGNDRARVAYANALSEGKSEVEATKAADDANWKPEEIRNFFANTNDLSGRTNMSPSDPNKERLIRYRALSNISIILNAFAFSPRLAISRTKPVLTAIASPARALWWGHRAPEFWQNMVGVGSIAATTVAVAVLAKMAANFFGDDEDVKIDADPRSGRFGQIQWGPQKIDTGAGYYQVVKFSVQFTTGQKQNASGEIYDVNRREVLLDFLRSKSSPVVGLVVDLFKGRNFYGEKIGVKPKGKTGEIMDSVGLADWVQGLSKETWNRLCPLVIQDVADALTAGGYDHALLAIPLATYGIGVQTYNPSDSQQSAITKNMFATETYGQRWNDLTPRQQTKLRKSQPSIAETERAAQLSATPSETIDVSRVVQSDKAIRKQLTEFTAKALEGTGVKVGVSRKILKDFYLNDARYALYQQYTAGQIEKSVGALVRSDGWVNLTDEGKTKRVQKAVDGAREGARVRLIREIEKP